MLVRQAWYDQPSCPPCVGTGDEILDASAGRFVVGVDGQQVPHRGVVRRLLDGETDEVEARGRGLDQVRDRADLTADRADLMLTVRRQGAHGDKSGLQQAVPGDHRLDLVGQLHDHRPARHEAQVVQARGQPVARVVELRVGESCSCVDDGGPVREPLGHSVKLVGHGADAPVPARAVQLGQVRRIPHHTACPIDHDALDSDPSRRFRTNPRILNG